MCTFKQNDKALLAVNIWDYNSAKAVMDAAASSKKNVILQTSVAIYKKLLKKQFKDFVCSYAKTVGIEAYLNLDHCKDPKLVKDAVDNGWNMVMIDASVQPLSDNIRITNEVIQYAHAYDCMVEAEVGKIHGTEDDTIVKQKDVASRSDIKQFLEETNVDYIAVAFGNAHGEYHTQPELRYDLVEYTTSFGVPFAVHGGSGLSDGEIKRLLAIPNVRKINISTDMKLAYRSGILSAVDDGLFARDTFQPVTVEERIYEKMCELVLSKLKLF